MTRAVEIDKVPGEKLLLLLITWYCTGVIATIS